MELSYFWRALTRHWLVALVVFGVCLGASGYLAYSPADRYQATATLLVEPSDVTTVGDVAAVNFLLPALQVQLGTASTAQAAQQYVRPSYRQQPASVGSSVEDGTGILRVTATGPNRATVAPWANGYAHALIVRQQGNSPLRITLIDKATEPGGPSGPARTSTLVSGGVLALILAFAAALVAHAVAGRRRRAGEIRHRFGVPVLAEIPRVRGGRDGAAPDLLRTDDESVVEPVLRARAAIEAQIATKDLRSICVTSHDDGDGKTTVVGALAAALAAAGHAVSVVEADLRHPALAERIGAEDSGGVEADLALDAADRASSHVTYLGATDLVALARSDVLPRHGATHPADVVTVALPKALRLLERPDAVVLVDTPSLRAAEAEVAARLSSGVLVVVDASKRRFVDTLEQALTQLRDAGATPVGVVLTRTRRRSGQGPTRYLPVGRSTATSVPRSRHATPLP